MSDSQSDIQYRIAQERSRLNSEISSAKSNLNALQAQKDKESKIIEEYVAMMNKLGEAISVMSESTNFLEEAEKDFKEGYVSNYNKEKITDLAQLQGHIHNNKGFLQNCLDVASKKLAEHQEILGNTYRDIRIVQNNLSSLQSQLYALNHGAF